MTETLLEVALGYVALGWYVQPLHTPFYDASGECTGCSCEAWKRSQSKPGPDYVCPKPGKHPRLADWEAKASCEPEQIRRWWQRWPNANIGIAAGKSGLVCLDADTYKEGGGDLSLTDTETVTNLTGGGGQHLIYKHPEDGPKLGNASGSLPEWVDVRGHGGQFVAPPSLHPSGRRYAWEPGYSPHEMEPAPLPHELRSILTAAARAAAEIREVTFSSNGDGTKPDLAQFRLSTAHVAIIEHGHPAGSDRSQVDQSIITALIRAGATDDEIKAVFDHYAIGAAGKYAEKGRHAHSYLARSIANARRFVANANGSGPPPLSRAPLFAVGDAVNIVIKGVLQNATPCIVAAVHPPYQGQHGYTVTWADGRPATYAEDNLEPAEAPEVLESDATTRTGDERHLLNYTPDDGGMLDDWLEHDGAGWLFAAGFEEWYRDASTHWKLDTGYAINAQIQRRLDTRNKEARVARKAETDSDRRKMWGAYVKATRRTKARIASIEAMARNVRYVQADRLDSASLLNVTNGTLDLSRWPWEMMEHDPANLLTYCLPYAFDDEATAPHWQYLIGSMRPEIAAFLQEFAGYALTPETRHELAVWLYGGPGGGKSTFLHGLQTMLGPKAGLLGLADIERSRFALAALPGKTLVVSTEQPGAYMASTHVLNALISGEPVTVDRKFRDPVIITPRCKVAWAMNDFPRVSDANNGIFRRVKVVNFPAIPESERRPELKDGIAQEGAGILNWALEGLRRLRERGRFDVPAAVETATRSFVEQNDIPANFVAECCYTGHDYTTQSSQLYQAYRSWALDTGHKPQSMTSMAGEWERLNFEKYMANGRAFWRGVGLKM